MAKIIDTRKGEEFLKMLFPYPIIGLTGRSGRGFLMNLS